VYHAQAAVSLDDCPDLPGLRRFEARVTAAAAPGPIAVRAGVPRTADFR
jgi:hypothetical protein